MIHRTIIMPITQFQNLPTELLLMITDQITDPCDLLALRLAHPFFNSFLKARFLHTFPRHVYMRRNCTGRYEYDSINSMLFWAAQHNHLRFYRNKLLVWRRWPGFSVIDRVGLSRACVNAAFHGNAGILLELFDFMLTQYGQRGMKKLYTECFVVSLTKDQLEISKLLIDRGVRQWWTWKVDNSVLAKAIEEHQLDVVEYWLKNHEAGIEEGIL